MRNLRASFVFGSLILLAACGGSDGAPGATGAQGPAGIGTNGGNGSSGTNGTNGTNGAQGDAGASFVPDAGAVPTHAPAGITFSDMDFATGEVAGTIAVQHATNESDVTSYAVYFGRSATEKLYLTPIFVAPADGADVSYPLVMNPIPAGATNLLAVAQNAAGESAIVATPRLDVGSSYVSVSAGSLNTTEATSLAIDAANEKLLIAIADDSNGSRTGLVRCNVDGTACTYIDISTGEAAGWGQFPSLAIDEANSKLLVATDDFSNSNKLGLVRCNLDGTSCTHTDISTAASAPANTGGAPSLAIDATNGKLLVATIDESNNEKPALFRCDLDGTSCTYTDISSGALEDSGFAPSLRIDAVNGKLLVATGDESSSADKPGLFRCDVDGTSCTYADLFATAGSGVTPSLAIDSANSKLLVATQDESDTGGPGLIRGNLDGSSCTKSDISAGAGSNSGTTPSLAVDATRGMLFVATTDSSNNRKLGFFSCDLDGTSCHHSDVSAGAGGNSGFNPKMAIDAASGTIVIATLDFSTGENPALFIIH